jgi:polyhydroxybutyrate depolymerase
MASTLPVETFAKRAIEVGGVAREVWVRLPAGYDPERAYPVVYQLHGCSGEPDRESNNVPVERESAGEAIHVRGKARVDCWDPAPAGEDVAYFDVMLETVEAAVCVDTARRFVTGYSSGASLAHGVACVRGDRLRGVATIAGGFVGGNCTGSVAALLIHDLNDPVVDISASVATRDAHLARNHCATPTDQPPCVGYTGCDAGKPVVWCQTTGQEHERQDAFAAPVFWSFLSAL